ncbi:MAG: protein-glutamate O-methyltransferase CheR [Bacteroidales bacterium]|nr:protein-glutamate O-methyltransferase CheR [Bacteroidales bacterium]
MESLLSEVVSYVLRESGDDISKYDNSFLLKSLEKRITAKGVHSKEEYLSLLISSKEECLALNESLSICYSEFFRNSLTFAYLEKLILPSLFSSKYKLKQKEVRIWSAACASGQEAYSLAILCEELIETSTSPLSYRIIATDIDPEQVEKAEKGVYSTDLVGNVNLKRLHNYFVKHGSNYIISKQIKNRVFVSQFDLLSKDAYCPPSSIFGDFDIVFCCNLLFYFKPFYRKSILKKITKCISADAYLVTGETERAFMLEFGFTEVFPNSAIFQMTKKEK